MPRPLRILLFYLIIPALLLFNAWLFRVGFGTGYFRWYLNNGAFIAMATGFIALIWENLEGRKGLVSLDPVAYFGTALQLAGVLTSSVGTSLHAPIGKQIADSNNVWLGLGILWDAVAAAALGLLMLVAVVLWIVVVTPMQWVVIVFAGAPARRQLRGGLHRTMVEEDGSHVTIRDPDAKEPVRGNLIDVTLARKPFAVTQALTGLVLFTLDAIWAWAT